ncbi:MULTISPECIES: ATP-binding cassette domain-containing protein [Bacillus]|uniref:ATP-binding cassette domain-containing protein n=1 Tax=Bacillus TaxID=1386 RepID=UPI0004E2A208|nr:ABC transporter ATP-binding protein [Bacillus subtilis]KFC29877.1 multidrug ABC transporter ATP-binding protein [Bacillus subtilis]QHM02990.1 Putative ABC transporter ATP-binding protein AlbC [Bacillus subtilis]QJD02077.1 Putative transporter involved in subtilosin production [Bacillus subtilis subsp. subtilis]QJD06057.1 Putative transporter involved in subtilosin production [Bacillus subtilis subsp. subtilis]QPD82978.1 ATP-binding cassette domain-containing protein [Bacillus subtilis]
MSILDIHDVSVWYERDNVILEQVDLHLEKGAVYGLLGVNGAGKTTLINTLTGVNRNFSGRFTLCGIEAEAGMPQKTSDQLKTHRYFAADYPLLFTEITAKDYVSFVHSLYQKDFSEQQFTSLAEAFHFSKYINRRISELSLGNRQKVVLMTGLLLRAPLFILDEPLVGLDVESIEVFYQKMREYCEAGGTILFSSHLLDVVQRFCDYAAILHNKQIQKVIPIGEETDLRREFFEVIGHE